MSDVPTTTPINGRTNIPLFTLGAAIALILLAILAAVFIPARNQTSTDMLVTTIIAVIPGLIAAAYSERNSRDMRNGVAEQKAKDGATKALQETGVTDVVEANGRGATSATAMAALATHTQALQTLVQSVRALNIPTTQAVSDAPATVPTPATAPQG